MNSLIRSACLVAVGLGVVWAGSEHNHPPVVNSPELQRIKQLAGIWKGTSKSGKEKGDATAVYQITSGGQVVTETLFAGTPNEMISTYYDQGGKLTMTHYCMLPNRPVLELKKADNKQIQLDLSPASGFSDKDYHMHALTLTWQGPDKLTHRWTSWKNGKPDDTTVITLTRVK